MYITIMSNDFAFVAELSPEQKQELADLLAFELRGKRAEFSQEDFAAYDAVHDVLGTVRKSRQPFLSFIDGYGASKFLEKRDLLDSVLDQSMPSDVHDRVRASVRLTVLRCLRDHIEARHPSPTPRIMFNYFGQLKTAVDRAFPGYMAAKILHRVAIIANQRVAA